MTDLFKKAIVFTDLHLGLKHNSKEHNEDCINFANWMVSEAKLRNVETCIFMGDFMHHRNTINSQTLDYALKFVSILNDNFEKTYFLVGNHDLYWRDDRSITSTKFATLYPNIVLIDNPVVIKNVALVPWLVNDEWKTISDIKSKYLFGHMELPGFKMNAHIEMPDHGNLNASHFKHQEYVFSGHFHKRQAGGKVNYIGNPFGHNYSDIWDFDRGAMFLEWDKKPEYINYEDGPRYINISLSSLVQNTELYLKPNMHLQVVIDGNLTYEDILFLRETLIADNPVREFKLIKNQDELDVSDNDTNDVIKPVDTLVLEQLANLDSDTFDINKLIEIYDRL